MYGKVYLVKNKKDGKEYGMKVLDRLKMEKENLVKYARAERQILSFTKHPFIVRLEYAFETETELLLIMQYCPRGDLGDYLALKGPFSEEIARLYIAEITLALEELHRKDIIFRDLKPENVVIDEQGHALLIDFGTSKEGVQTEQFSKTFCGTLGYLAPEMLMKTGHGKSLDWYMLGTVLYELLIGQTPFFTENL